MRGPARNRSFVEIGVSGTRAFVILFALLAGCQPAPTPPDGGQPDSGADGGATAPDAGEPDAGAPDGGADAGDVVHFDRSDVVSAVTKSKNLLTGLPPTRDEVALVESDPRQLSALVERWMGTPAYDAKMTRFFSTAFQQSELNWDALKNQYGALPLPPFLNKQNQFVQNLAESFGRTALQLVKEGQPFTTPLTTRRFMMTTALMAAYALLDASPVADGAGIAVPIAVDHALTLEADTPIPLADSLDPSNDNYMRFYDPAIAQDPWPGCPANTVVFPAPTTVDLLRVLIVDNGSLGYLYDTSTREVFSGAGTPGPSVIACHIAPRAEADAPLTAADFADWKMVTTRAPAGEERTTDFFNIPAIRQSSELVLNIPRVGFFSTVSFFGQWPTNTSNQARVTINQTLIVALGEPIGLTNTTRPNSLAALDQHHARPGTDCYDCHQSLDPMRQYFRQAYTLAYSAQTDPTQRSLQGEFAFQGVTATGTGIDQLGSLLGSHPMYASAWVQKLCTYANSAPCDVNDPEYMRLVSVFVESNYSWNTLVKELFSSPLITHLREETPEQVEAQVYPIARQEHVCATLSNRLGIPDVCGLAFDTVVPDDLKVVQTIAATWPSDAYGRGNPTPVLANAPSLFMRTGQENICAALANHLVDNRTTGLYSSNDPTSATEAFVQDLMGLEDEDAASALAILQGHFSAAVQSGSRPRDALKSTFVLACESPFIAGVGL